MKCRKSVSGRGEKSFSQTARSGAIGEEWRGAERLELPPPGCWGAERGCCRACAGRCGSPAASPGAPESRQQPAPDAGWARRAGRLPAARAPQPRRGGPARGRARGGGGGAALTVTSGRVWEERRAADSRTGSGAAWVGTAVGDLGSWTQPCVPHPYCGAARMTAATGAPWGGSANQGRKWGFPMSASIPNAHFCMSARGSLRCVLCLVCPWEEASGARAVFMAWSWMFPLSGGVSGWGWGMGGGDGRKKHDTCGLERYSLFSTDGFHRVEFFYAN